MVYLPLCGNPPTVVAFSATVYSFDIFHFHPYLTKKDFEQKFKYFFVSAGRGRETSGAEEAGGDESPRTG